MKKLAILLALVVFAAGCVSNGSDTAKSADAADNQNAPPPFPDESTAQTTADSGTPSLPNSDAANPDEESPYTPPPVPAILGLVGE